MTHSYSKYLETDKQVQDFYVHHFEKKRIVDPKLKSMHKRENLNYNTKIRVVDSHTIERPRVPLEGGGIPIMVNPKTSTAIASVTSTL